MTVAHDAPGRLRFGLHVPNLAEPATLVELGVTAEAHGWDGCFLWDHVGGGRDFPVPVADPWVTLGALASRTSRIRLGTMVTAPARRRAQKLARETVTLDRLSGGRVVLGVGLGRPVETEYAAFGEQPDPRERAARLDEQLSILAGLWSGRPFTHRGPYYEVDDALFLPTPAQTPRIPIWVACSWPHRRPLVRAARWDGVVILRETPAGEIEQVTPDQVAAVARLIRELRWQLRSDGSAFDIAVVGLGLPAGRAAADALAAAGATWWLATGRMDDLAALAEVDPAQALLGNPAPVRG